MKNTLMTTALLKWELMLVENGVYVHTRPTEAKLKGIKFGRKRKINREQITGLYASGVSATKIAKEQGVGRSTIYKLLKEAETS